MYTVLRNLFAEVTSVFPAQFIHLGGDEVHYPCWKKNENITQWMAAHNMTGDYDAL